MKKIIFCTLALFLTNANSEEFLGGFEKIIAEGESNHEITLMADREEEITRAAKAKKERLNMGVDYENGNWVYAEPAATPEAVKKISSKSNNGNISAPTSSAFRFGESNSVSNKKLPKVVAVIGDKVKLNHNGATKSYAQGEKIGQFYVDNISIHAVILRDENSRHYELSTDW